MGVRDIMERAQGVQREIQDEERRRRLAQHAAIAARTALVAELLRDPSPLGYRRLERSHDLIPGSRIAVVVEPGKQLIVDPTTINVTLATVEFWSTTPLREPLQFQRGRYGVWQVNTQIEVTYRAVNEGWCYSGHQGSIVTTADTTPLDEMLAPAFDALDGPVVYWVKL